MSREPAFPLCLPSLPPSYASRRGLRWLLVRRARLLGGMCRCCCLLLSRRFSRAYLHVCVARFGSACLIGEGRQEKEKEQKNGPDQESREWPLRTRQIIFHLLRAQIKAPSRTNQSACLTTTNPSKRVLHVKRPALQLCVHPLPSPPPPCRAIDRSIPRLLLPAVCAVRSWGWLRTQILCDFLVIGGTCGGGGRINYIYLFDMDPRAVSSPLQVFNNVAAETVVYLANLLLYYKVRSPPV